MTPSLSAQVLRLEQGKQTRKGKPIVRKATGDRHGLTVFSARGKKEACTYVGHPSHRG